jgi:hypothetical protein
MEETLDPTIYRLFLFTITILPSSEDGVPLAACCLMSYSFKECTSSPIANIFLSSFFLRTGWLLAVALYLYLFSTSFIQQMNLLDL